MDTLESVGLGGRALADAVGKPWGRLGKPWGRARRSSFVVGRSSLVFRRLSFGAGRWLVDILGNPSLRSTAFEDALASFSDTLKDKPSWGQFGANMNQHRGQIGTNLGLT